jgi:hypothetical protein
MKNESHDMKQVSQAYLIGVCEARAEFTAAQRNEFYTYSTSDWLTSMIRNIKETLALGFADEMRDCLKGQLDFYQQQAKIKTQP